VKGFAGFLVARPVVPYVFDHKISGIVRGSGSMAAYIEVADVVLAITGKTVPLMPNGISVMQQHGLQAFQTGARVDVGPDEIRSTDATVSLRLPTVWDPSLPQWKNAAEALLETGREMWWRLQLARTDDPVEMVERLARGGYAVAADADGRAGLEALFRSLVDADAELARRAADLLTGRGPGLTPEGDDFLAAVVATVHACEPSISWLRSDLGAWRVAVLPDALSERTTLLSATLLHFARFGWVSEPVQTVFDLETPAEDWLDALRRLKKVGHGTGRAWAAGCAAAAILLTR
jgi:hypothetical protein